MLHRAISPAVALMLITAGVGCAAGVDTGGKGGASSDASADASASASASGSGGMGAGGGASSTCTVAGDCGALNDPCNVGACVNGTCVKAPANDLTPCDDGLYCTDNDTCKNGVCVGGTTRFCDSPDACHIGVCDEATDSCTVMAGNDGAQCDDGDPCTLQGTCAAGTCSKGGPVDCSVFDDTCSVGQCDPVLGCQPSPVNDGSPCDDGLFCTINDVCTAGKCGGAPNPCAPPGGCYIASCDENTQSCTAIPGNDGQPCDDGNDCTKNTTCSSGACINGQPDNEGAMCDDGSSCTSMTTCTAGVCGGGVGPTVYFADDFHDSSKGWILGKEWQIGPAMASPGLEDSGYPDPAFDHSQSADNGIAGIVIGGDEFVDPNNPLHPFYYLESPPFNTANAQGSVILGFYRWLNSDYAPFMVNTVDVWNGGSWVNLWTSDDNPIEEDSWNYISYDLTAYKNAGMKIRFGYDIEDTGVFVVSGWNIDDVLVASGACP